MLNPQQSNSERREYPRLTNNIPIKIIHDDGDIVTETANISRSGIYCKVNKFLNPMTKLKINLLIPLRKTGKDGKSTTKKISCVGAVVRSESVAGDEEVYNVAIFFQSMSKRDTDHIADYVNSFLESDDKSKPA